MKRLIALCSLVVLTVAFALSAQAQVFKPNTNYKIKFDGFQYAYSGVDNHSSFMSGATTLETNIYDKSTKAVSSGYKMTSIVWASHINTTDAPGKEPANYPPVYADDGVKKGIYVGILSDLYADRVDGDALNGGTAYFTGGTLDWYYFEDLTTTDMSTLAYVPGKGLVFGENYPGRTTLVGQEFNTSSFTNEHFAHFDLAGKDGSGSADLEESSGGDLIVKTTFYGNAPSGSLFDSNKYGENESYDLKFTANLTWNNQTNRFSVDDPAYVSTPAATPEPGTIALMALGLLLTGYFVRQQRSNAC